MLVDGTPGTDSIVSDSGWSNTEIFMKYTKEHLIKFIPARDAENPVLVIFDGHASHVPLELTEWARENHIILQLLPAYCSHFLQPMDVSCFGTLVKTYNQDCQTFMRSHIGQVITRNDVCGIASKAYIKSLSPTNLIVALNRTGIHPFNPEAIDETILSPSVILKEKENRVDTLLTEE